MTNFWACVGGGMNKWFVVEYEVYLCFCSLELMSVSIWQPILPTWTDGRRAGCSLMFWYWQQIALCLKPTWFSLLYRVDCIIELNLNPTAVDTCLKASLVFILKYPLTSHDSWIFLQRAIYSIEISGKYCGNRVLKLLTAACEIGWCTVNGVCWFTKVSWYMMVQFFIVQGMFVCYA